MCCSSVPECCDIAVPPGAHGGARSVSTTSASHEHRQQQLQQQQQQQQQQPALMFGTSREQQQQQQGGSAPAAGARDTVLYGQLIVLGHNGCLPLGDKGRRRSRFNLYRRSKANGVKPSTMHVTPTPQAAKAVSSKEQHSVSYTLSRSQTVVVEYAHDKDTDMFQIGRSTEGPIDFVVTDTPAGNGGGGGGAVGPSTGGGPGGGGGEDAHLAAQSTISRFACRVVCARTAPHSARIYAAGFDSSRNIFLGEKAAKWKSVAGQMDGLTTNGVLVMTPRQPPPHTGAPEGAGEPSPGTWREISVCGNVYSLRETRSAQLRGHLVDSETNVLRDGSLVDLCGATLLWRTAEGLARAPTLRDIDALRQEINAARPQCPVGLNTLAFPSFRRRPGPTAGGGSTASGGPTSCTAAAAAATSGTTATTAAAAAAGSTVANGTGGGVVDEDRQPWAYLACGHVHGRHEWGLRGGGGGIGNVTGGAGSNGGATEAGRECPMCRAVGPYVALSLGREPAFYVDAGRPAHALSPCGHVCSEKTARYWARVSLPHGTHAFHAACPFCGTAFSEGERASVRLIFQGPLD
ncbi:E3 ubiquitin-protein ligase pellino homolog 2-like isoform X1 [Lethenteron reissneri]|uniref:E3 ubiquitin-protein ligase pellino homolog 2-like isoform X1 n=1 Tax=Lethenteron reissneri TaxID=7753 RepID=UPI002AB74864|nr:E3 ubiquitin-protein ligase pellino homolog 2-like isoform X1 [Lethenteron reissneri]XP_061437358.1 E3 ubiquitin-protein ligase pellino homolog 2-like isoform X1 [Lethenteron reissneri]